MIGATVKRTGSGTVLKDFISKLQGKVEGGLKEAGQIVLAEAKGAAPRDTGALEESGRVSVVGSGFATVIIVGFGGSDRPSKTVVRGNTVIVRQPHNYALFVELLHPTQPDFLRRSVIESMDELRMVFNSVVFT